MSFQQLLSWLYVTNLEEKKASQVAELVGPALDELEEEDPNFELLLDIEEELEEGRVPVNLLSELVSNNAVAEPVDDVERLTQEYHRIAESLPPEQWQSNFYLDFEKHLAESEDEALFDFAESLRAKITASWTKYAKDFELMPGKSAETEVGHRLMKEAFETWMESFELLEEGFHDEQVLEAAEVAVRLLAAVNQLDQDVQRQAKALDNDLTFRKDR